MIYYLVFQGLLISWNILNARFDAHRIMQNKTIAHGINFAAYAGFVAGLSLAFGATLLQWILWALTAFFCRQLAFDIPLNLRRGLPWYYQSTADRPKAVMDIIERWIFPTMPGQKIAAVYAVWWAAVFTFTIIVT